MTSSLTASNFTFPELPDVQASGEWSSRTSNWVGQYKISVVPHAGSSLLALALAVSPLSLGTDISYESGKQELAVSRNVGRASVDLSKLTASEARGIALQILHLAEAERAQFAEDEAQIHAVWEAAT